MKIIDCSGPWRYRTDEEDIGLSEEYGRKGFSSEPFLLPGSTCDNKVGRKQGDAVCLDLETLRAPRERYFYLGPLWLEREVEIPADWEGKEIRLFLERVNMASELWVDGEKIGRQIIELSTPHCYRLTDRMTPGTHRLTLRIDNRNLLNIDMMASGYSIDTQGYWNGMIGRIELQCRERHHLGDIQIYPDANGILVKLTHTSAVRSPLTTESGSITLSVTGPVGEEFPTATHAVRLYHSSQVSRFYYEMKSIHPLSYWDEFHPSLYQLHVRYTCEDTVDEEHISFGMRTIARNGKQLFLNERPLSLRGNCNCAIFPLTGYPAMEEAYWKEYLLCIRSYGLNHVRFHAWCPPESAFAVADQLGIYLGIEMPLWLNRDVCKLEFGEDPIHADYFTKEAACIMKAYGNHPSFLLFSCGNEILGDFALLEDITIQTKALDSRHFYTLTSNFDHPLSPCEDYFCAFEAGGRPIRLQNLQEAIGNDNTLDYQEAVDALPVPILSFEVGQYCIYPDVSMIEQYTGNMLPVNFQAIRMEMERKKILHRLEEYVQASADLAGKLYKEDIEALLRTKGMGGFQLLSLFDYTGQNTATVGLLDIFMRNKGGVSPANFCEFCSPVVPLLRAKRILSAGDVLSADFDLYDYGDVPIENPVFHLRLLRDGQVIMDITTDKRHVDIPLDSYLAPCMLIAELSVEHHRNQWSLFVFPKSPDVPQLHLLSTRAEIEALIEGGGRAIIGGLALKKPRKGSFTPVFWSPAFFKSDLPCGAIIRETHPLFRGFPTERYPDYQWKALFDRSLCADISAFADELKPIVEFVPNFMDNTPSSPLFAARVGKADFLFCGFDLEQTDSATAQLKHCIGKYMDEATFDAAMRISPEDFLALF